MKAYQTKQWLHKFTADVSQYPVYGPLIPGEYRNASMYSKRTAMQKLVTANANRSLKKAERQRAKKEINNESIDFHIARSISQQGSGSSNTRT